jgi:tRNA (adenine57-N1/adenine58-N1)-methyltransferase
MTEVSEGDFVLLYLNERMRWLVRARDGLDFHTHRGIIRLGELIGKPYGGSVRSTLGFEFYLLPPTVGDHIVNIRRPTQILYDKDIGLVLFRLGIRSGCRVVEAGTGSGAMAAALANAVRPEGHVYSYEIRREFVEVASQNLRKMGLEPYVTIRNADARLGFEEEDVDAVFIDLEDPWSVIDSAYQALKGGHMFASFSPTLSQVERAVEEMKDRFVDVETVECFVRNIRVEKGRTRPRTIMIGHTGYLTFARKVLTGN